MRGQRAEIEASGAEIVLIGSGTASHARAFAEDESWEGRILLDRDLRAYRAAGLRRGRVEVLSPRMGLNALRAIGSGHRQTSVQGDPWQLGGVLVVAAGGALLYRQRSREAGDHADLEEVREALLHGEPIEDGSEAPGALQRLAASVLRRIVDPTVLLSFDRTGFRVHALGFDPRDLEVDLSSRRCVVTGANSGIGFETAKGLADLGADTVLVCRNEARGLEARDRIMAETGNPRVSLEIADVSRLDEVRRLASRLGEVDVLVHNAGVLPETRSETPEGLETVFATHVAGPYLLTEELAPALSRSQNGRVIFVSSGGMYTARLQVDDWNWEKRVYDGVKAYAETKRAQVLLAELFARRLEDAGVVVHSMHPGWADTPAVANSLPRFHQLTERILRTPAEGADTVIWLAAAEKPRAQTGRFWFDREPQRTHWLPTTRESETDRRELAALCEELTRKR